VDETDLEKQMKVVIKANRNFQKKDAEFTSNVVKYFNLSDDEKDYLFSTFDDIVDTLQYATGNISWTTFKKHVSETKEKHSKKG
jgi:hypothetical protein